MLFLYPILFWLSGLQQPVAAAPVGGIEQIEQVCQSQIVLPKMLVTPGFECQVTSQFRLDDLGHATDIHFDKGENNVLRHQLERMIHLLTFVRSDPHALYYLNFNFNASRYNRWVKDRPKHTVKRQFPTDSSYAVYERADQSPEYYKDGDAGMAEYLLSSLEYPAVATEKSIQGTVEVSFIVETNGLVSNAYAIKSVNGGCTEEALRLIRNTRWQPAVYQGRLVRYRMRYPIVFALRNVSRSASD
jgi:TonB family protein